jgi:hypothetical protein
MYRNNYTGVRSQMQPRAIKLKTERFIARFYCRYIYIQQKKRAAGMHKKPART